jgi:hypothetical protein
VAENAVSFSTFDTKGAPIIFDMCASLAITPDHDGLVEHPTPLKRPMTLGGMVNYLVIMVIGNRGLRWNPGRFPPQMGWKYKSELKHTGFRGAKPDC